MEVGSRPRGKTGAQERGATFVKPAQSVRDLEENCWPLAVHLLGVHFNSGLQTYLTLTYSKKYIFYSSQETHIMETKVPRNGAL